MNLGVTIGTAPVEVADVIQQRRGGRMPAGIVTGIAYARHAHFQQLRIICAVSLVTGRTVLHNRRMLPEKWSAAFGMAAQAVRIRSRLNELLGIGTAVWVVATGAGYFAFPIRHM